MICYLTLSKDLNVWLLKTFANKSISSSSSSSCILPRYPIIALIAKEKNLYVTIALRTKVQNGM